MTCAYTQKVVKFSKMMVEQGHEVFLYAGTRNEAICSEHIEVITEEERLGWYGKWDTNKPPDVDWSPDQLPWGVMAARTVRSIKKRREPGDILCMVAGWSQQAISKALPQLLPLEWAVGYEGIHHQYRVFESYAWMHHVYGLTGNKGWDYNTIAYDTVIPNFFDPVDFHTAPDKDDYLLFIGRLVRRKGPDAAARIAALTGRKLIVAGPGAKALMPGRIIAEDVVIEGDVEYVGAVGADERAELMSRAAACIVPTLYVEPFGGVAVEAMMCGTPVVATDWGAFPETVQTGISGYRFRTLREGARAVEKAVLLDTQAVSDYAHRRYSIDAVGPMFSEHFERLQELWDEGGWFASRSLTD
jgi:glycosyltransferase involved in cell wall biosynthesis